MPRVVCITEKNSLVSAMIIDKFRGYWEELSELTNAHGPFYDFFQSLFFRGLGKAPPR